jgi:hypothetical protein
MKRIIVGVILGIALTIGTAAFARSARQHYTIYAGDFTAAPQVDVLCGVYAPGGKGQLFCTRPHARNSVGVIFTKGWVRVWNYTPQGKILLSENRRNP